MKVKGNRKSIAIALTGTLLLLGAGGFAYRATSHQAAGAHPAQLTQAVQDDYTCPMHHSVHSDHPGSCPICGMTLVKRVQKAALPATSHPSQADAEGLNEVALSPQQMVTANVTVTTVTRRSLSRDLRSPGKVAYDESLQSNVTSWVAGRIDRLYVSQTGQTVRKGEPIAEIYSPDLMTAQQEYLTALESSRALASASFNEISHGAHELMESAKSRLQLLGVTDAQVAHLNQTRHPLVDMTIFSPVSGTVTQKIVQLGQFVGQGQPIFQVADLSKVWVEAPLHEDQLAGVRVGQTAELTAAADPNHLFRGRISFISPVVDPQTRTVEARIALENGGGELKPEMFVETLIHIPLGDHLVIPASAVVETGTRQVVWIESRPHAFVPREVRLGDRSGDYYPVLSGLAAGERIAATGAYLIDSSSQMQSLGGGSMPGMDMSKPKSGQKSPSQGSAAMPGMKM